jgi:hypothetical protein
VKTMATHTTDEHERSAAGLDFEDEGGGVKDRAAAFGSKIMEEGPGAVFEEIENLLPETWREHIRSFPIAAVALGLGVGVWLGMKKSEEILAAGTSLVSAAAMANVTQVMDRMKQG